MDKRETVLAVIAEVCKTDVQSLKPETELAADLGIDSAKALHLLVELEDRLETEIDDEQIKDFKTVGDLLTAVDTLEDRAG